MCKQLCMQQHNTKCHIFVINTRPSPWPWTRVITKISYLYCDITQRLVMRTCAENISREPIGYNTKSTLAGLNGAGWIFGYYYPVKP